MTMTNAINATANTTTINASTTVAKLTFIRHEANTTFKWHNMTVKKGHYYGCLTIGDSIVPVFWSGWVSNSAIYLYNAISCMGEWVDNDDLHNPEVYILGEEPYVEAYDKALYEWENDSCGYRPKEGDYLPFWVYDKHRGWNPLYL